MKDCCSAEQLLIFKEMPKTKEQKKQIVEDLKDNLSKQKAVVFIGIKGIKAKDIFDLRENLKKANCLLSVIKKTLLNLVLKDEKLDIDAKKMEGEMGLVFGFEDQILPSKIVYQFSKTNNNLKILGGIFENKFINQEEAMALALLPSREELYSKVVGTISAPISGFVNVLQGNIKGLITILIKIKN